MSKRSKQSASKTATPAVPNTIWTVSNGISLLRLLLAIPVFFLLREPWANRWWVFLLFMLAYLSDLADGYIARRFNTVSEAGKVIDPLADKVFVLLTVLAMVLKGMIPVWFVIVAVARDLIIFSGGIVLKKKTGVVVASNMTGKAAVVSIGLVLIASLFADSIGTSVYIGLLLVSCALMAASLTNYGRRFFTMISKQRQ
jgi:cardiolipin synthase (CMP-forming)